MELLSLTFQLYQKLVRCGGVGFCVVECVTVCCREVCGLLCGMGVCHVIYKTSVQYRMRCDIKDKIFKKVVNLE